MSKIDEQLIEQEENQNLPAEQTQEQNAEVQTYTEPQMQVSGLTMWNDTEKFTTAMQMAQTLSKSEIVPQSYKGKPTDCMIAIDMANRMGVSPIVIMQNSQIVQGNFSWKGTACKAMIDGCGRYRKTRYVEVGERGTDSHGYYLEAETKDGEIVKGVTVDLAMAKAEGWYSRNPKWKSMGDLMLRYRAAAFFFRTECASLAMGFLTAEEQADIGQTKQVYNCEECGKEISAKWYMQSVEKYGVALCSKECLEKHRGE